MTQKTITDISGSCILVHVIKTILNLFTYLMVVENFLFPLLVIQFNMLLDIL